MLAEELRGLGAQQVKEGRAGVAFTGSLEVGYRTCLWSRLASRVLMVLARISASIPEALYEGVRTIGWDEQMNGEGSLAVDCQGMHAAISHTHYAALTVKDAIVDQFRDRYGTRPSVELTRPDLRVNVFLQGEQATVSLDLAGESLHRRGYRRAGVEAPLKENLAAAILLRAGWPSVAREKRPLVDLMCGSGTLLIEGALLAADCAPGLLRDYFGFSGWKGHDPETWHRLLAEARERRAEGLRRLPHIAGYDADPQAVRAASANLGQAGLADRVRIERRALSASRPLSGCPSPGLVVVNPPYGERMGKMEDLRSLYTELGEILKRQFAGWKVAVFTGDSELGKHLGLQGMVTDRFYNGALECRLLRFHVNPRPIPPRRRLVRPESSDRNGVMFANRLRKNLRILGRWARKEKIDCFRLYDADMPEYALAVDLYRGEKLWVHVQEYRAPLSVEPARATVRRQRALAVIPEILEIPQEQVFFKVRERKKGRSQYEKQADSGRFYEVHEGPCVFLVNFTDYLDTGLFLDHRPLRELIRRQVADRRFLNLFGYTGAATVHAAAGGATSTTTVDLSHTYLGWARRNLERNGFAGRRHALVQADCQAWLAERQKERYDLILLDPPTFSNSRRMHRSFDVQRDHVWLIRKAAALLEPEGMLIFSTNFTRFRMHGDAMRDLVGEDITRKTIPRDFARNPRIHCCWRFSRR